MKKNKKITTAEEPPPEASADGQAAERSTEVPGVLPHGLMVQGWWGIAVWMSFGLLLEGLIGFRIPDYLGNTVRRELFQLAHTHGALLSILLVIAALFVKTTRVVPPAIGVWALRIGAVLMPLGFLLGGVVTFESDPNPAILLSPAGGVMVIFGVVSFALSARRGKGTA